MNLGVAERSNLGGFTPSPQQRKLLWGAAITAFLLLGVGLGDFSGRALSAILTTDLTVWVCGNRVWDFRDQRLRYGVKARRSPWPSLHCSSFSRIGGSEPTGLVYPPGRVILLLVTWDLVDISVCALQATWRRQSRC